MFPFSVLQVQAAYAIILCIWCVMAMLYSRQLGTVYFSYLWLIVSFSVLGSNTFPVKTDEPR